MTAPASTPAFATGLRLLTRPGLGLGFRLAGLDVAEVAAGAEGAALRAAGADPTLGVVAVDEAILAAAPAHVLARLRARGAPVVLSLPLGDVGHGAGGEVARLLRRALGYAVRLGEGGGRP